MNKHCEHEQIQSGVESYSRAFDNLELGVGYLHDSCHCLVPMEHCPIKDAKDFNNNIANQLSLYHLQLNLPYSAHFNVRRILCQVCQVLPT